MITVTCRHCSVNIEVDSATRVALRKSLQFQCPNCSGFLPTSLLKGGERPVPRIAINRNLIILGSAALLVLGGISYFAASRKTGDNNTTTQHIRNEIINNSYFQNLITSGVTTMKDLDEIAAIRPFADGYIGISAVPLNWEQSIGLAGRTGAQILSTESAAKLPIQESISSLSVTLQAEPVSSMWIRKGDAPAVLVGNEVFSAIENDEARRTLLHWHIQNSSEAKRIEEDKVKMEIENTKIATNTPRDRFIETFTMSLEEWTRIPAAIRDDHAQLHKICLDALGSGKIERIDRIGGPSQNEMFQFAAEQNVEMATTFVVKEGKLVPSEITNKTVGSTFEGHNRKDSFPMNYDLIQPSTAAVATLGQGSRDEIKSSEIPVFEPIRLNAAMPAGFHGTRLLGLAPLPALGGKATKIALLFHTGGTAAPAPAAPGGMIEFLLFRATTGAGQGEAPERIKNLLVQRDAFEAAIALRSIPDSKGRIDAETEWVFPTSAVRSDRMIVPQNLTDQTQGTSLEMQCLAFNAEGAEIRFILEHDLAKPELPLATGRGNSLLSRDDIKLYKITHQGKLTLIPNTWTSLGEIPISNILPSAKNQSSYLFARAIPDKL